MVMKEERIWAFDILRIASAFAVVLPHVCAEYMDESFFSSEWVLRNFFNIVCRWCVPVFIMISGALFLNKTNLSIKTLYSKYISRIILIYIFWSTVYACLRIGSETNLFGFIGIVISGPKHLWFLKMLIGLYMCLPLFWMIVKDKKIENYFLCLSFLVSIISPFILFLTETLSGNYFEIFTDLGSTINFSMALGYSGYFVLGHYLSTFSLNSMNMRVAYAIGIACAVFLLVMTYRLAYCGIQPNIYYYRLLTPFMFFISVAVFILVFQHCKRINNAFCSLVIFLSKMSLGVYVMHILVMHIFSTYFGIDSRSFHPAYWLILYSIIIFAVSYLISWIMSIIPFLKRMVC